MPRPDITRAAIVASARSMLGVKWVHQGRSRKHGLDCIGMPLKVCDEFGIYYEDVKNYRRVARRNLLKESCDKFFVPIPEPKPGSLSLFDIPPHHHAAIHTEDGRIIHAYASVGRVVENTYDEYWQRRAIAHYDLTTGLD